MLKLARYLVDVDCAAYYLCGREPFVAELLSRYDEGLAMTALAVAELYECAQGSQDPKKAESSLEEFLLGVGLAPMTVSLAREVGRAKARLSRLGVRVSFADLVTACTAGYYGLKLLTTRPERYEGLLPQESMVLLRA